MRESDAGAASMCVTLEVSSDSTSESLELSESESCEESAAAELALLATA
jgi:hypothetical protein